MSQINTQIFSSLTLAAGASSFVDMDLANINTAKFLLEMTYANGTNASATGLTARFKNGFGSLDASDSDIVQAGLWYAQGPSGLGPSITFSDNYDNVASIPAFPLNFPSSITIKHFFYLSDVPIKWGRYVRLELINGDATKALTLGLRACL